MSILNSAITFYKTKFANKNFKTFFSPGRINLIGEHTDYNGGLVFPAAINKGIYFIGNKRDDEKVLCYSNNFKGAAKFSLKKLNKEKTWSNYLKAVFFALKQQGYKVNNGIEGIFFADLPSGAGLSSSASFLVLAIYVISYFNNLNISKEKIANLAHFAENKFVGVNCGIMDQFVVAMGKNNKAIFLNCDNLNYEYITLNLKDYCLVLTNSKVKRELSSSQYNKRREECETAISLINNNNYNLKNLSELSLKELPQIKKILPIVFLKRCKHIISENQRVSLAKEFLSKNDLINFGKLLTQSHNSLKNNYEVSCKELNILVSSALKFNNCLGSRMVGAGFGGCTLSLVKSNKIKEFKKFISEEYYKKTKLHPDFILFNIGEGVKIIN